MRRRAHATGLFGWSRLSNPERFDTFIRWSMYAILALEPYLALMLMISSADYQGNGALIYLGSTGLHLLTTLAVFRPGLDHFRGRGSVPVVRLVVMAAMTLATVVVAFVIYPGAHAAEPAILDYAVLVPLAAALAAVPPLLTVRGLALLAVPLVGSAPAAAALGGNGAVPSWGWSSSPPS